MSVCIVVHNIATEKHGIKITNSRVNCLDAIEQNIVSGIVSETLNILTKDS